MSGSEPSEGERAPQAEGPACVMTRSKVREAKEGCMAGTQVGTAAEARLQTWRAQALTLPVNSKSSKTELSLDIC